MRGFRLWRASPLAALACGAGTLLALAATLPSIWWQPLHMDEGTTLELATRPWTEITHDVFVSRGGGPLHFYLEHLTLSWPGGLEGLQLPSILFLAAALPLAWLVGRDLLGRAAAAGVVLMLALAPLSVSLGAFARPYTMLLFCLLLASWLSIRAARANSRRLWVLAGALAGALFVVHPLAPLYSVLAFATGPIASERPFRKVARSAIPGAIAFVVALAPYVLALGTLSRRYEVGAPGSGSSPLNLSVPANGLDALTPSGRLGWTVFAAAAICGLAILVRSRPRVALALGLWLAVPVVFFTLTPAGDTHFVGRYMFPALPAFLLLMVTAFLALPRLRLGRPVLATAAIGGVLAWSAVEARDSLMDARSVSLPELAAVVESLPRNAVVFGTTGVMQAHRTQAFPARLSRSAELLDSYLELALDDMRLADELPGVLPHHTRHLVRRGAAEMDLLLDQDERRSVGIWILAAPRGDRLLRSGRQALSIPGTRVDVVADRYIVVRTTGPRRHRELLRTGIAVRQQWAKTHWTELVEKMIWVNRLALSRSRFWWLDPTEDRDVFAAGPLDLS